MNKDTFHRILEQRLEKTRATFYKKNKEYGISDVFHNFKQAARIDNTTPIKALRGFDLKHRVSVQDMVDNPSMVTEAMIDEKIGDCIVYLCILEGLFLEHLSA